LHVPEGSPCQPITIFLDFKHLGEYIGTVSFELTVITLGQHLNQVATSVNADRTSTWTASTQDFTQYGYTLTGLRRLMGSLEVKGSPPASVEEPLRRGILTAPAVFDTRTQWGSKCPSLYEIRDQGNCGSCWAFGVAEVMTDRYCLVKNITKHFSAQDINSCCSGSACGNSVGCNGGYPSSAWSWAVSVGVVSGANCSKTQVDHNNVTQCTFSEPASGCSPYSIPECNMVEPGSFSICNLTVSNGVVVGAFSTTPVCNKTCTSGYTTNYASDKVKARSSYSIAATPAAIMSDISTYGPVTVSFNAYTDFVTYRSGVYSRSKGAAPAGGHCVKMVGYNSTATPQYWIVANSWNNQWGSGGFFNIVMGNSTGNCDIENSAVAGHF